MLILWHSLSTDMTDAVNSPIPVMVRRKLTPFGRLAVGKLYEAHHFLETNKLDTEIPWVVSSRHGDPDRIYRLLGDVITSQLISPMDFSQSVHNALIGSFSITTKNKSPHTAIASGEKSFESGLMESFAQQKTQGGFVGYLYYDTAMPTEYDCVITDNHSAKPTFIAMILGPDESQTEGKGTLKINYTGKQINSETPTISPIEQVLLLLNGTHKKTELTFNAGEFHIAYT